MNIYKNVMKCNEHVQKCTKYVLKNMVKCNEQFKEMYNCMVTWIQSNEITYLNVVKTIANLMKMYMNVMKCNDHTLKCNEM